MLRAHQQQNCAVPSLETSTDACRIHLLQLTGVGFLHGGYHRAHGFFVEAFESEFTPGKTIQPGSYEVHRPNHWIFEGTALPRGAVFGERHTVVGYECDGCDFVLDGDGLPVPTCNDGTPPSFQILATAPARWAVGECGLSRKLACCTFVVMIALPRIHSLLCAVDGGTRVSTEKALAMHALACTKTRPRVAQ